MSDVVWVRSIVECGAEVFEDYVDIPRETWDSMTREQQKDYLIETAVDHQNNVAPCGAEVVDESEVPQDYIIRTIPQIVAQSACTGGNDQERKPTE